MSAASPRSGTTQCGFSSASTHTQGPHSLRTRQGASKQLGTKHRQCITSPSASFAAFRSAIQALQRGKRQASVSEVPGLEMHQRHWASRLHRSTITRSESHTASINYFWQHQPQPDKPPPRFSRRLSEGGSSASASGAPRRPGFSGTRRFKGLLMPRSTPKRGASSASVVAALQRPSRYH